MATDFKFHPEALLEYSEAAQYYLRNASARVAAAFVATADSAIAALIADPNRWPVIEEPEIRRCVLRHFPFVVYYRWEPRSEHIVIYAVMHCSRRPGYWLDRTPKGTV